MEFFDQAETWDRANIEAAQVARLRNTVEQAGRCAFYAERFAEAKITPADIRTPDDIRRIPFTTKDDLRSQYPEGLLCVPREHIVRMHSSSGTTGMPTAVCHTRGDLHSWADLMARCMYMVGVRRSDVFQNMAGYGLFTGGLGIHSGAERLGCMTIPAGAGNTLRQIRLIKDFKTTVIHIIPSYALVLANTLRESGEDPSALPPRIALVGAEPHSEQTRRRVEEALGVKAYNSYGLSEMNGPGVAFECLEQNGLHVWEDAYIVEIVNPETGEQAAEGESGELVLTTLCRAGMPILRYRTRDLTRFLPGVCACGRAHRRVDRIQGRTDDMFIIKGVNIYPMQIEKVIMAMPEVGQNYLIVLESDGPKEELKVKAEIRDEYFVEDMRALQGLRQKIARRLQSEILVTPKVELVQSNSLPAGEGKAQRVVDLREK
ncbi:MAG: phenylacetate--CoA ligase [Deltaproteobacteria bacterium]|jgi:phenylacetate-CoA ligase|nr:phenylacetate--CoA ligase [Deltaproteobacteria bacterium]